MLFWLGISVGVVISLPLVIWVTRRTERRVRALERRAVSAERLAELGTMTGGLAHEIKNPLSTINLNGQLLREDITEITGDVRDDEQLADRLSRAGRRLDGLLRETQRLRDILEDFLRFAGRIKLDLGPVDVNGVVDELGDFFAPQAEASGVHIRKQLGASPSVVQADVSLLKQAMLNLLINATQAMHNARGSGQPHGGCNELIVRTERSKVPGGDEIRIHVTDTGPGIPPENVERIFQPYFSTKKDGTGLGLPTARRLIQEHGGTLHVISAPGRGSDFVISLPLRPVTALALASTPSPAR